MSRPRMVVVAGPPGSGKTSAFPVTALGLDAFNIDDRCAQLLGSYRAIPRDVRRDVAAECEQFVLEHIHAGRDFGVETTLRTTAAIVQAAYLLKAKRGNIWRGQLRRTRRVRGSAAKAEQTANGTRRALPACAP